MKAGKLDRVVRLEHSTQSRDAARAAVPTWTQYAEVWAQVTQVRGAEVVKNGILTAEQAATFLIRFRDDVRPSDRIVYNGKPWNVRYVREFGRREGLELTAELVE